jgi:pyrimidine operon attenuation protein/uracil phosphoribosyltransferase
MPSRIILNADELRRTLARMAHEVLEHNRGVDNVVLIGLLTRGFPIAQRLAQWIDKIERIEPTVGALDISLYRDDLAGKIRPSLQRTEIPFPVEGKRVILVDDVLYTGRSIRAAMDALTDFGRASSIQLGVLVDRGHRELPIRADYVGKNIPTAYDETVAVRLEEIDGADEVVIESGITHA